LSIVASQLDNFDPDNPASWHKISTKNEFGLPMKLKKNTSGPELSLIIEKKKKERADQFK